ncbi:helix-turn-helix transcriptional regulator [Bacillus cereus]|uniref:helix-turn-helix domain-containing protein n=1 Tax=Bacillus cereus TaxID=1396 RepID=UPI0022828006|nr:helix-turn-helix transcriptional regulator [Bacillus cereus]
MKEKAYQSKPLLTKREREVFELLVQDKTTKEIAGELFISEKTVRNHISNVMCSDCIEIYRLLLKIPPI